MTIDIDTIYPLIVPVGYIESGWKLPHYILPNKSFILAWVSFSSGASSMLYLTEVQQQSLDNSYSNWQQISFENLRRSITDKENICTGSKLSEDGRLIWIAFMHSDGIGSSRVLLSEELTSAFSNGYYLAFPDRSCGLAISKDITDKELAEVKKMVAKMHKGATTAMSGQLHERNEFDLPEQWAKPIDINFSEILVNEIKKLTLKVDKSETGWRKMKQQLTRVWRKCGLTIWAGLLVIYLALG